MRRFEKSRAVASRFDHVAKTGSTNADLVASAAGAPDLTVLVADEQTAGRGRLDRIWVAPPGSSLTASVLIRPRAALAGDAWGWFPLLAGAALRDTLEGLVPGGDVTLKWPNDVQIGGRKVSGILAELVLVDGAPDAVVVGVGVNLTIERADLPTAVSTSLALEGATAPADELADAVVAGFVRDLRSGVEGLLAAGGDPASAGLPALMGDVCDTVGRRVRVELPGGSTAHGRATGVDRAGRLVVLQDDHRGTLVVAAGDVTHLRYE